MRVGGAVVQWSRSEDMKLLRFAMSCSGWREDANGMHSRTNLVNHSIDDG